MSKTTICKRARRKVKQARELDGRLAGFLEKSDSIKQVPNIKNTRKQIANIMAEARELWFEKVKSYLEEYVEARMFSKRLRRGNQAVFSENLRAPDKEGKIVYQGDIGFKDGLTKLPAGLEVMGGLDLESVNSLSKLPPRLTIKGVLNIAGTSITELPGDLIAESVTCKQQDALDGLEDQLNKLGEKGQVTHFKFV